MAKCSTSVHCTVTVLYSHYSEYVIFEISFDVSVIRSKIKNPTKKMYYLSIDASYKMRLKMAIMIHQL